jgi:ankyrin repeat protein
MQPRGEEMSGCDVVRVHEAFVRGDLEGLRDLLGNQPEFPNSPSPSLAIGNFLEYAIYHSPLAFVRTLLELGATIDYEHSGFPCLIAALSTERADKSELLGLLLSFGADIEQRGVNDHTPLHYSVSRGDSQAVKLLLDHGADPQARTRIDDYSTPLEDAERQGSAEMIELLRQANAARQPEGE